ncbi:hypothetical protein HPP92_010164 [Vanilla planifolia]|uniref:Uncharacterized protein n=1 Tax=Vanilla planifolia TaxID=51239 RepID=A0A835V164_VANPL|nr:hypothetical protein HPP92_010164 [Vanilla planifolia]
MDYPLFGLRVIHHILVGVDLSIDASLCALNGRAKASITMKLMLTNECTYTLSINNPY